MRLNPNYYTSKEKRTYLLIAILLIFVSSVRLNIHYQDTNHSTPHFTRIIPEMNEKPSYNKSRRSSTIVPASQKRSTIKPNPTEYLKHASPFNPNEIDELELQKMKFPDKGIQNLIKYRMKGGSIKTVSQFKRIWGFEHISDTFLDTILLFPSYAADIQSYNQNRHSEYIVSKEKPNDVIPKKTFKPKIIDINNCDTTELKSLKGIGPWRAHKIIEFRERLGGFHSPEQLATQDWLPDSIYQDIKQRLKADGVTIQPLQINQLSLEELAKHPYINYAKARMITNYIVEHGPLKEKEQLLELRGLDSSFVARILPYLDFSFDIDQNSF